MDPIAQSQPNPMTPPSQFPPMQPKEGRPVGPIIGVVIIVILLIAAAVYVWGQKLNNDDKAIVIPPQGKQINTTSVNTNTTPPTSVAPTDDLSKVEANVNASLKDLDNLNF